MKILVDEMRDEIQDEKSDFDEDLSILQQQIEQCRTTLKQLVVTAEASTDGLEIKPIREYFGKLLERWQVMRPKIQANIHYSDNLPEGNTCFHSTIAQSLTNLLNNAADASPERIEVALSWDTKIVELSIRDYGEGITPKQRETLGKPFNSEKPDGMGLGLFLTQASINRYGGEVTIRPASGRGTLTQVLLPLTNDLEVPLP